VFRQASGQQKKTPAGAGAVLGALAALDGRGNLRRLSD
jgi:hypothetical protein